MFRTRRANPDLSDGTDTSSSLFSAQWTEAVTKLRIGNPISSEEIIDDPSTINTPTHKRQITPHIKTGNPNDGPDSDHVQPPPASPRTPANHKNIPTRKNIFGGPRSPPALSRMYEDDKCCVTLALTFLVQKPHLPSHPHLPELRTKVYIAIRFHQ